MKILSIIIPPICITSITFSVMMDRKLEREIRDLKEHLQKAGIL